MSWKKSNNFYRVLVNPELFITILKWWVKNIFYIILNTLFYKNSVFPKDPLGVFIEVPGDRCDLSDLREMVMNFSGNRKNPISVILSNSPDSSDPDEVRGH